MNNSYEPIIVSKDKDGKIVLTEEELKVYLKQAYENGYAQGRYESTRVYFPKEIDCNELMKKVPKESWTSWSGDSFEIKG